jgi:pimeloyl-ACP methyl ester carboxylesterase
VLGPEHDVVVSAAVLPAALVDGARRAAAGGGRAGVAVSPGLGRSRLGGQGMTELAVVPGTSHGLLVEKPELCDRIILDFLEGEALASLAPIRRR